MKYLVEINDYDIYAEKSLSEDEVMEEAKGVGYENIRTYIFDNLAEAEKIFDMAKGLIAISSYGQNMFLVRAISLIEVEADDESEYHYMMKYCCPEIVR